jgi:hypothetical protein
VRVSECNHESSIMMRPWPTGGCCAMVKKMRKYFWIIIRYFAGLLHISAHDGHFRESLRTNGRLWPKNGTVLGNKQLTCKYLYKLLVLILGAWLRSEYLSVRAEFRKLFRSGCNQSNTVHISFGYILYCVCFNLYSGCFNLFCKV